MNDASISRSLKLCAGDLVQVRSKEEILATLDENGRLEQMPFMPEMLRYCGKEFRVGKRAHKTCDPVNGLGGRKLPSTVHLEGLRCDGSAHGGCQAGCLLFWKEAWLQRKEESAGTAPASAAPIPVPQARGCTEDEVLRGTVAVEQPVDQSGCIYVCQATQVAAATTPLPWWDFRQYIEDFRSGNVSPAQMISSGMFFVYHTIASAGLGIGSAMRWVYDIFQKIRGGTPYPWRPGKIPRGSKTPVVTLNVQPGEWVRVKDFEDIRETLDEDSRNRGMYFDAEVVPFCNHTFQVLARVERIIDEKSGRMLIMKTPSLILDGVVCEAKYAKCRKFCPRGYYQYAREIWVERVAPPECPSAGACATGVHAVAE